jgi:phosphate starvation-inducible PhoH-like protein
MRRILVNHSNICNARNVRTFVASKYTRIAPKNDKQQEYIDVLTKKKPYIVVATGSAGTGKTMLATYVGINKLLKEEVKKIVITRPAVSVDEAHGFLPGNLEKKMEPWMRPVFDILSMYFPANKIEAMIKDRIIEVCPLAYMRGRTFDSAWIICDEAQNTTINQMLMVLTRIGKDSKIVITGDPNQYDRGYNNNGLSDLLQRIEYKDINNMSSQVHDMDIEVVEFTEEHVERHPVIPVVLNLYKSL